MMLLLLLPESGNSGGSDAEGESAMLNGENYDYIFAILSLISPPRSPSLFSMYHMNEAAYEFSCNFSSQ